MKLILAIPFLMVCISSSIIQSATLQEVSLLPSELRLAYMLGVSDGIIASADFITQEHLGPCLKRMSLKRFDDLMLGFMNRGDIFRGMGAAVAASEIVYRECGKPPLGK